jgi:hypothetical protein
MLRLQAEGAGDLTWCRAARGRSNTPVQILDVDAGRPPGDA